MTNIPTKEKKERRRLLLERLEQINKILKSYNDYYDDLIFNNITDNTGIY
jgi:hypothetical protein